MKISRKVGKTKKIALPLMKARDRFLDELCKEQPETEEEHDERINRERPDYGPDDIGLRAPTDSFFEALPSDYFDDYGYDREASLDRYDRQGLK